MESTNLKASISLENPKNSRKMFSIQEDALLINCVSLFGENNWKSIIKYFPNRCTRQIRERYNSYLKPGILDTPWTHEEDLLLSQKIDEFGKHWSMIAKFFKGRNQNNIKNRWNFHLKGGKILKIENNKNINDQKKIINDIKNNIDLSVDYLNDNQIKNNDQNFQSLNTNFNQMHNSTTNKLYLKNKKKSESIKDKKIPINGTNQMTKNSHYNYDLILNSEKKMKKTFYSLPSINSNKKEDATKIQNNKAKDEKKDDEFDSFWNNSLSDFVELF